MRQTYRSRGRTLRAELFDPRAPLPDGVFTKHGTVLAGAVFWFRSADGAERIVYPGQHIVDDGTGRRVWDGGAFGAEGLEHVEGSTYRTVPVVATAERFRASERPWPPGVHALPGGLFVWGTVVPVVDGAWLVWRKGNEDGVPMVWADDAFRARFEPYEAATNDAAAPPPRHEPTVREAARALGDAIWRAVTRRVTAALVRKAWDAR